MTSTNPDPDPGAGQPIADALNHLAVAQRDVADEVRALRVSFEVRLDNLHTDITAMRTEMRLGFGGLMDGITDLRRDLRGDGAAPGDAA